MDCNFPCTLVLGGKSSAENEIAKSLKHNNAFKCPENDGASVVFHSELNKSLEEESFVIDSYMNSLSTNRFGRLLIWSPRLPSTHDVISQ